MLIVTDDNPRTEDPARIRAEVLAGAAGGAADIREVAGRRAAIAAAVALARPGDVVAVLGKGHESGQEIDGAVHPFDDRVELAAALAARGGPAGGAPPTGRTGRPVGASTGKPGASGDPDDAGRHRDGRRRNAGRRRPGRHRDRQRRVRLPGGRPPAACSPRSTAPRSTGTTSPPTALEQGAVAVLATRPIDAPAILVDDARAALGRLARAVLGRLPDLTVIGLTGSSGKTTTKDLLAGLLRRLGPTVATAGSFNNELGLPHTVLRATAETRYLVLEMGSRGVGHIRYLCELAPPHVGVVVNVGVSHIGEFGSVDAIAEAKGELVEALPAGRDRRAQRRRPAGAGDVGPHARVGRAGRRVGRRRGARARRRRWTTAAGRRTRCSTRAVPRRCGSPPPAGTRWATRCSPPRWRCGSGCRRPRWPTP